MQLMRKAWLIALLAALVPLVCGAQQGGCGLELPVHEPFDSYGIGTEAVPTCWYVTRNYDLGYAPHLDGSRRYNGTASMVLYPGSLAVSHYSMLIAPALDSLASFGGVYLRFMMLAPSTAARLEVGVCADTNRSSRAFVALDTLHVDQSNRWQEMVIDLGRYAGTGRRIAFRMQRALQSTSDECYIDDLHLESCGTTTPWANHIGSTSATLHFESFGAGVVEVTYGNTVISPASSPLVVNGLVPDSEYVFHIGCAGTAGTALAVHTMEGAGLTTAYYENFDAVDSVMPRHWRRPTANKPQVAGGVLRMMPAIDDSSMAVLPLPANAVPSELNMALTLAGTGTARLVVGVVEYADEPESFVPIDTLVPDGSRRLVPLASYAGQGLYPALLAVGNGTLTVDEVRLARCMAEGVRLYNLTESELTLAWDTLVLDSGAAFHVEYGTAGFALGSGTRSVVAGQPLTISGLTADQDYDLYLWPTCGDQPAACDRHRFHTFAHEMTPPYCTGFEDGALPQGWVATGGATLTEASYEGAAALQMAAGSTVAMPLLGADTPDTIFLEFYAFGSGQLLVGQMATPYSTFVPVDTLSGDGSWQRHSVRLAGSRQQCLALRSSSAWTVDALSLRTAAVHAATVSAVEQRSAQVAWTMERGDSVRIEYAVVAQSGGDFEPGSGTVVVADSAATLTGLAPGTHYSLHISPYDSLDDGSCHHLTLGFTTLAAPVEIPYCQNFDGTAVSGYPANWRRLSDYGDYPLVSNDRNRSGGRSLRMSVFGSGSTVAILPDLETCSDHPVIALWANATANHQSATLLVGTLTDVTDASTFTAVDTMVFGAGEQWLRHMTRLDSAAGHPALMLKGAASGETRVYIEDLCIEPCVATNIQISDIDSVSAIVSWSAADSLYLVCRTTGNGTTHRDTLRHSPATIGGFSMGTAYTISFQAECGCGATGAAYRPWQGSTGTTADGGIATISINTQPTTATLPYCNTFEGITNSTPSYWRSTGTIAITDRNYHNGSHSLQISDGNTVVLPPINGVADAVLSFHLYGMSEVLRGNNAVTVGIVNHPDSLSTFVPLDTLSLTVLGTWQHLTSDLAAYTGHGRYVAISFASGSGTVYMDDLMVATCCISDASVAADGTVGWRTWHGVDSVVLEYGPAGFTPGDGTADTVACTADSWQSTLLPAITDGETYDIYLSPKCSDGSNCQRLTLQLGNITTTPYCENFDGVPAAGMPTGWMASRTYGNTPEMASRNGSQRLHMKATAGNRSIATLPALSVDSMARHQLSLDALATNHNRTRLFVGQMSDVTDPNTFIPRDTLTLTASGTWQTLRLPLTRMNGTDRMALACDATVQSSEVWIDNMAITHGLTPHLAILSARRLRLTNTDTDYYVEYGPAGTLQGEGTTIHVTDSVADITDVLPEQTYWLYCRHTASEATCLEPLTATMPREESLPYCHRRDTLSSFTLPELGIDSLPALHLYFTLRGGSPLEVGVMERQGDWSSFIPVDTAMASPGTWQPVHIAFGRYHGDGRFVAMRTTDGTNAIVDGMTATACELPVATLDDDNRIILSGVGTFEYGPSGFTPGTGMQADSPVTLTLADTTAYDFYPLCPHGTYTCGTPTRIATTLPVQLPYCTDFNAGMPAGWTAYSNAVSGGTATVNAGRLTLQASQGQTVGTLLPIMPLEMLYLSFDMGGTAQLLLGDTILAGAGHKHVAVANTTGRLAMQVAGGGNVTVDNLMVEPCDLPDSMDISQPGNGLVEISWDDSAYSGFFVEYALSGQEQGTGTTARASVSPMVLNLDPDTAYDIYLKCDSTALTCHRSQRLATLSSSAPIPYCTDFESDSPGSKPTGWRVIAGGSGSYGHVTSGNAHGGNRKLTVSNTTGSTCLILPQPDIDSLRHLNISFYARFHSSNSHSLVLGVMSDASDPTTFDSLTSFTAMRSGYTHCLYVLDNYYGNGKFLALKLSDSDVLDIDDLSLRSCAAYHFRFTEMESDHVVLTWEQQGSPEIAVTYGPRGFGAGEGTTVYPTASPFRIEGLSALTSYAFHIGSTCIDTGGTCGSATSMDTFYTFTPQGGTGCIDYTDLNSTYVTCAYGSYLNPMENTGAVDYGYQSALSRHTVHYDTAERDSRTQGLLRTIPEGELASVRLGNWTSGGNSTPQSESITYGMTVDASKSDLLVLRYAAVLQDPEHAPSLQPRFRMEILNQAGALVDSCSMADFIADENLGWAQAPNEVLWKDWTTVGVDLGPYDGQTIYVRLTTHDCGEGSHFGYAYFTLGCASKLMEVEGCSYVPNNRFSVPSGFNYRWYSSADTTATISDSSSIWVASDNSVTYYCRLSFVDNPTCHFTMSAFAGARFPLAIIDTALTVADCEFDLQLFNHSTISGDGVTPVGTGESCDTYRWLLPGGASTATAPTLHLTDTGTVSVTLIVGIANDQCIDTLTRNLHIAYPHPKAVITGRSQRCLGDDPDTIGVRHAATYRWADGSAGTLASSAAADTVFRCFTVDTNGCRDTLAHPLSVHPTYDLHDYDSVCSTESPYSWRDTALAFSPDTPSATARLARRSQDGCDSIMSLDLHLWPVYYPDHRDTVCDGTVVPFFDTLLTTGGTYLNRGTTQHGCDSLTTIHLAVMPVWDVTDRQVVCDSLRWIDGRLYTGDTVGAVDTLLTPYGCDSVVALALTVHPSKHHADDDTACAGHDYLFRGRLLDRSGYYADTLATTEGCDSVLALNLTVMPMPQVAIDVTADCGSRGHVLHAVSDVPYLWWLASPYDSGLEGRSHHESIMVHPDTVTTYRLYADYRPQPLCPATVETSVGPLVMPKAQMRVSPRILNASQLSFEARDVSEEYAWRQWFVGGELLDWTGRVIHSTAEAEADTVSVMLVVGDNQCSDTALTLIPIEHTDLIIPNAFTPGAETNREFYVKGYNIAHYDISVYNRRGVLVYRSSDIDGRWDGRNLEGHNCPSGNYIYYIIYTTVYRPDVTKKEVGSVLLVR